MAKLKEIAKEAAAKHAVTLIEDGMTIGIGTGSTATYFIKALANRCQSGLNIRAVATSVHSHALASSLGISMIDSEQQAELDLTIDGADQIDQKKRLIKGGGGALLREKIVASMSHEMIVIADESKCVKNLGNCLLPVEVLPFGVLATLNHLKNLGQFGQIRKTSDLSPYTTDNGNFICDINCNRVLQDPEAIQQQIVAIPGVIETGLFIKLAGRVIIGTFNGKTHLL